MNTNADTHRVVLDFKSLPLRTKLQMLGGVLLSFVGYYTVLILLFQKVKNNKGD